MSAEICERFLSVQADELDLECTALIAESVVYRSDSEPRGNVTENKSTSDYPGHQATSVNHDQIF